MVVGIVADDITLTVRVRDLTRGDFNRLDRQLDDLRGDMRDLAQSSSMAGDRADRLDQSVGQLSGRFQRLQQTGSLSTRELTHMRRSMGLLSREARQAADSGEITSDQYKALRGRINETRLAFDGLTRDIDFHRTRMRGASNDAERQRQALLRLQMAQTRLRHSAYRLQQGDERLRLSQMRTQAELQKSGRSANHAGRSFGKMRLKLIAAAVALAATVLPTIGALSPMLFGLAGVGGAAALAFGDMKEEAKKLKPEFEALKKVASGAVMPGFKKAIEDTKHAMKGLGPAVKVGGEAFGEFTRRAAAAVRSPVFQGALRKNIEMGSKWFLQFSRSIGIFTQKFMEFGTKSQLSLDAWQALLGGFLDTGLPGMFKELEKGIGGASKFLEGFAYFINRALLPGLGKLLGSLMNTFGGVGKEQLILFSNVFMTAMDVVVMALDTAKPVFDVMEGALRGMNALLKIVSPHLRDIGVEILSAFAPAAGVIDPVVTKFQNLDKVIRNNRTQIFFIMNAFSDAMFSMVSGAVGSIPVIVDAFKWLATMVMDSLKVMLIAAEASWGWVPGIGDKLKTARENFDEFSTAAMANLNTTSQLANKFADETLPRLEEGKVKVEIKQATAALAAVKKELADPNLTKERRAQLTAEKKILEQVVAAARRRLNDLTEEKAQPQLWLDDDNFKAKMGAARRASVPRKTVTIGGNTDSFWSRVNGIVGSVLGTAYINVEQRMQAPLWKASGGVAGFARGGLIGAAGGGPRSRLTLVGEQGPELVDLAPGSRVRSNPDTRRLADSFMGGGGGGPIVIQLNIGDKYLGEVMLDPLRKVVRTRGGNVQAVLGKKGA